MSYHLATLSAILLTPLAALHAALPMNRPNILWLIAEDMSPHFGCYGEKTIQTPNVEKLAASGVLFENAFVTAPICSPSRSALITGMYQTSIGAHHHRSGVGVEKIMLPADVKPIPQLFQKAGYQTSNGSYPVMEIGKTDYNFEYDAGSHAKPPTQHATVPMKPLITAPCTSARPVCSKPRIRISAWWEIGKP